MRAKQRVIVACMRAHTPTKAHGQTVSANPAAALAGLVRKPRIAELTSMSQRNIEVLVKRRMIPVIRVSKRLVLFDPPAVMEALRRLSIKEVGAPRRQELADSRA
jgi:hypothetical protein